jgi:5-methylcytosine-specific restriction endonuclease McrA
MGYAIKSKVQHHWKQVYHKAPGDYRTSEDERLEGIKKHKVLKQLKRFRRRYIETPRTRDEILFQLRIWAMRRLPGGGGHYGQRRAIKHKITPGEKCGICKEKDAVLIHHIIQLKNDGTESPYNLVPACQECHEEIHPWLKNIRKGRVYSPGLHPASTLGISTEL